MRFLLHAYQEILENLRLLCDREWQERVWIRGEGPEVSSFREHVFELYEDTTLIDRLETAGEHPVFSHEADATLLELHRILFGFDLDAAASSVLNDPRWTEVRALAARSLQQLEVLGPPTEHDSRPEDSPPQLNYYDVFVLCKNRTRAMAEEFLDHFLPSRISPTDEYPFPRRVDKPVAVFRRPEDVLERLEVETEEDYALHWHREGQGQPTTASLYFTADSTMIAGLATNIRNRSDVLNELAGIVGGTYGYVIAEGPPPTTSGEFIECCENSRRERLVDGRLLS